MTLQTLVLAADVPEDQTTAAEAACAAFVQSFTADVEGATVTAASWAGASLLPSPQDEYEAALAALEDLSGPGKRPSQADLTAAITRVRDSGARWMIAQLADTPPATAPAAPDASGMVVANETAQPADVPPFTPPADVPQPAVPATQPAPVYTPPSAADVQSVDVTAG